MGRLKPPPKTGCSDQPRRYSGPRSLPSAPRPSHAKRPGTVGHRHVDQLMPKREDPLTTVLESRCFSFRHGGRAILQDINFSARQGDFLHVVGPNGAGKTTLLKCILRMWEGGEGELLVGGRSVRQYSRRELARQMAYVPQADGREVFFSVEDFVLFGRYPHRGRFSSPTVEDRRVAWDAMELTHTAPFARRTMLSLSGGERQKVYIAAALAQQTPILLLDEPAAFLDPRHQAEVDRLLRRLCGERRVTVVSVTHDVHRGAHSSDKVLALKEGGVVYFGGAESFFKGDILESLYGIPFDVMPIENGAYSRAFPHV